MFVLVQGYAIVNLERYDVVSVDPESDDDKRHMIYAWIGREKRMPLGKYSFPRCVEVLEQLFEACQKGTGFRMPNE